MYADGWSPADALALVGGNRNNNDGLFGGEGIVGLIALIIISGMFGFGGFGGFGGGMNGMWPWLLMSGGFNGFGYGGGNAAVQGALTRGDLCNEFSFNDLQNGVRNVSDAVNTGFANLNSTICHQQYDTAMLVNGINNNLTNGFHSVDNSICTLGYQNAQLINGVQRQISDCCCENRTGQMQLGNSMERGFCDVNYAQATNTNAIIQNAHNDTDRILARIDAFERNQDKEKIAQQAAEIQAYKQNAAFGAMIDASRAEILLRTGAECPRAAYIVQPPQPVSFNTNCSGQAVFGNSCNSGCGNGCGCGGY